MIKNTLFEIEDGEILLHQLQQLNEIFQQDWLRVLNRWNNLKATWQDKQCLVFESQFQKLLSIYKRSGNDCEEYILEIEKQIEIVRKNKLPEFASIGSNTTHSSIRSNKLSSSSQISKDISTTQPIRNQHPENKNTPSANIKNNIEQEQMLNNYPAQKENFHQDSIKNNSDSSDSTTQKISPKSVLENNTHSSVDNSVIGEQQPNLDSTQRQNSNQYSLNQQSYCEPSEQLKNLKTQSNRNTETNSSTYHPTNTADRSENWTQMQQQVQKQLDEMENIKRNASESNSQRWEIPLETTKFQIERERQYIYLPISSIAETQETKFLTDNKNLNSQICEDFTTSPKKTLNIYNPPEIDSRAAAIAAYLIKDKNPEAMINSIAKKKLNENNNDFLLKIETSTDADYDALSSEYFSYLNHLQSLSSEMVQKILAVLGEKSTEIGKIAKMLKGVINLPKIIFNNCHLGDKKVSEQREINFNIGGDLSGVVNLGEISGNVTNTIQQLPDSPDPEKPGIKELLTQLKETINAEKNMTDEEKAEALEQVQALAEAGQKPKEGNMQKQAKKATTMLRGIIAGLPAAAQLAETFNNIVPKLTSFFGL